MTGPNKPIGKLRLLLGWLVLLAVLGDTAAAGIYEAWWRYDIYANGIMAEGKVLSARPASELRRFGDGFLVNAVRSVPVYDHAVAYGEFENTLRLDGDLAPGTAVKVYYSRLHPEHAILPPGGGPWTGLADVFLTRNIVASFLVTVMFLFALGAWALVSPRRKKRRDA